MKTTRQIVAIGGGGFLMEDTSGTQERFLLSLVRTADRPRVVFLGTGLGDPERGQTRFFRMFTGLDTRPTVLPFFPFEMKRDYAAVVREADLVYVGGGNTPAMIAVWREAGFDRALRDAYESGAVLAGISAGANCWFEQYVTDSVPGGGVRAGLGWLGGTFCPHLDGEPWRQPFLEGTEGLAVGAGDHVMVHYVDEVAREAIGSRAAQTMCVRRETGESALSPWPPRLLPGA